MPLDLQKHHRRSIRLKEYDYSQAGAYFFTIVTQDRAGVFGDVLDREMVLGQMGVIVQSHWDSLPRRYPNIELDEFVVMPNHVHGIVVITENLVSVGAIHELPLPELTDRVKRRKMLLPKIIGYFKMNTAKRINVLRGTEGAPFWQRNYWEHIIRNERELNAIRNYIINNPANWNDDEHHPSSSTLTNSLHLAG